MREPVAAFDILPMAGNTESSIQVALAIKSPDGKLQTWDRIDRRKFLQIINSIKPRFVCTDNPYEIIHSEESVSKFCNLLPPITSLVHINSDHKGNTQKLSSLVAKHKIQGWDKKSPLKTAISMLKLIVKGEGVILEPFDSETIITIGRPKRHKKGGWSQARFSRQNEEIVQKVSRRIESLLIEKDISFDLLLVKSRYGAKNARFHLFLSRSKVARYFQNINLRPAKIKFTYPTRPSLTRRYVKKEASTEIIPLSRFQTRILVGIDPGTTVGLAIMDIDGKMLDVFSYRQVSKGEIVRKISDYGSPVLFCADVNPIPNLITRLAARFDVEIISPKVQLSKLDKRELAKQAGFTHKNNHEIDALAAVSNGFNLIKKRFIPLKTKELNHQERQLAKTLVLKGLNCVDATVAVQNMQKRKDSPQKQEKSLLEKPDKELVNRLNNLLTTIAKNEETISYLRNNLSKLETEISIERSQKDAWLKELQRQRDKNIRDALTDKLVGQKSHRISILHEKNESLRNQQKDLGRKVDALQRSLWIKLKKNSYPLKVMPVFSHNGIEELFNDTYGENELLVILDASGGGPNTAKALVEKHPRAIFYLQKSFAPDAKQIFVDSDIPILRAENYGVEVIDTVAIIPAYQLEKALSDFEKEKRKTRELENAKAFRISFENYQFERKKAIEKIRQDYSQFEFDVEERD